MVGGGHRRRCRVVIVGAGDSRDRLLGQESIDIHSVLV